MRAKLAEIMVSGVAVAEDSAAAGQGVFAQLPGLRGYVDVCGRDKTLAAAVVAVTADVRDMVSGLH